MFDFDPSDYDTEHDALEAYHCSLEGLDEDALQFALRNGYVPTQHDVLIEAGTRCLPLLGAPAIDQEPGKSALARLESIMVRLWPHRDSTEIGQVLAEWDRYIKREKRTARNDVVFGCSLIVGIVAIGTAVLWWWLG